MALAGAALALPACGGGGGGGERRVPPEVAKQLPTHEYALSQDICPKESGAPPEYPAERLRRERRRGERELAALERAYRDDPDAVVRATFTPADEPGIGHEDISVRDLADTHLAGLEGGKGDCYERAAARLRALLEEG